MRRSDLGAFHGGEIVIKFAADAGLGMLIGSGVASIGLIILLGGKRLLYFISMVLYSVGAYGVWSVLP